MPSGQSHFPLQSYGTLAAPPSARLGLWCNLTSDSGRYIVTKEQVCLGRHTWGAMPFGAWGKSLPLCSAVQHPSPSDPGTLQYHAQMLAVLQRSAGRYIDLVAGEPFGIHHGCLSKPIYEAKYTTLNPIQLPTTPSAEYALVNINGRNS